MTCFLYLKHGRLPLLSVGLAAAVRLCFRLVDFSRGLRFDVGARQAVRVFRLRGGPASFGIAGWAVARKVPRRDALRRPVGCTAVGGRV